jgi:ADP-ribose pyrophosphatase YjhB (NUDIX family)
VEERVEPGKASLYRPPGGMIKFGQRSKDCIVREIREELQAEVKDLRHVGTIENIFEYEGELGHEIVLFMKPSL